MLVFVPHPDDELAACGMFIAKAVKNGCAVKVVMVTNGDGFGLADRLNYLFKKPGPDHFKKMSTVRQEETIRALSLLGVEKKDIIFLGFPDRCSLHLWRENWDNHNPHTSKYTNACCVYHPNSYSPGTAYTGSGLVNLIEKIIHEFKPTHVLYPHFYDWHVDHYVINSFVKYAIAKSDLKIVEYTYLIHRGNWPVPPGKFPGLHLTPPKALSGCGIKWYSLDLTPEEVKLKEKCLLVYKSQLKNIVMRSYLFAFLRKNELFAIYDDLECLPDKKYKSMKIVNPFVDSLRGYLNRPGVIKKLSVTINNTALSFNIRTMRNPKPSFKYLLDLSFFNVDESVNRAVLSVENGRLSLLKLTENSIRLPEKASCKINKNNIHISLPANELPHFRSFLVSASSYKQNSRIDRTGERLMKILDLKNISINEEAEIPAHEPPVEYSVFYSRR